MLTGDELSRLLTAVSVTASSFGFERLFEVDEIDLHEGQPESAEYPRSQLLAYYKRADEMTVYSRVAIHVNRIRRTGETVLLISDRDGDSYDAFTRRLQAALSEALSAALPGRRVTVTRR